MDKLIAFILYFVVVLGIGIFFFFKSKGSDEKEYFLGGRHMGPFVTAMSAQASDMSGWLLMGFPGSLFAFGMGQVWIGIGLALGTAGNWIFVATRLRRFSKASGDSITLPQYLTNRFASQSPVLKVVCAIIFLISFTVYVASGFVAGTAVFTAVIPTLADKPHLAMIIFAVLILMYTFLGGYKAVCWTDFFQGIMMLVALLAVPIVMKAIGDFDPVYYNAFTNAAGEEVAAFGTNPFAAPWQEIVTGLGWGLGYFGMPHILVRFMSIEKPSQIKKSATVAIIWVVLTLGAAAVIAYLGRTFILGDGTSLAELLLPNARKNIFIEIVSRIFPGFIAGVLLSAIIAAAMSTADSQLLVASSAFTSDIYKPLIRKNSASDKEMLWAGRIVVLVIALVALLIAANPNSGTIMGLVENAWGVFGAAFGPAILLSLFWKRFTFGGAVAGIAVGAVADILWLAVLSSTGIYEIVPGFFAGLLAAVLVSLLGKGPGAEVEALFDKASKPEV